MKSLNKLGARYEILEHRADLKIRAFGKTKEELFQNMLLAMQESMKPEILKIKENAARKIKIKSLDLPSLLVDFLSEILYLNQVNKETYQSIKITELTDNEIKGELQGKKAERFGEDIKAATYHQLDIHQKKDGNWEAAVLFDI